LNARASRAAQGWENQGTRLFAIYKTDLLLGTTGVEGNRAVALLSESNASVVVLPGYLAGLATSASRGANRGSDL
jgi:CTP:molybdopterin cytidylyltransferase MocA